VEQDVTASLPQGSRHKIYSPHATHILDDDKEDTRAAETWHAERCTLPGKISISLLHGRRGDVSGLAA
jgi:hypothetical protein